MSIYVFGNIKQTVEALDDKSLSTMMMEIGQAVCNAWAKKGANGDFVVSKEVPLRIKNWDSEWSHWVRENIANYKFLSQLGLACCVEHRYRYHITAFNAGYWNILRWALDNIPNLDVKHSITQPPLIMPEHCIISSDKVNDASDVWPSLIIIFSYRNYYAYKIKQKYKYTDAKWTRRLRPKWLEQDNN